MDSSEDHSDEILPTIKENKKNSKLRGLKNRQFEPLSKNYSMKNQGPVQEPRSQNKKLQHRRRSSPPDLLELSNIYFDRQQKLLQRLNPYSSFDSAASHKTPMSPNIFVGLRPDTSESSSKPTKLEPLRRLSEAGPGSRVGLQQHGLHLSVKFSSSTENLSKANKPLTVLEPMDHTDSRSTLDTLLTRKYTFSKDE